MSIRRHRSVTAILVFSLACRVAWIIVTGQGALSFSDDARAYQELAANLVERHQFVNLLDPPHRLDMPYAQRPPLTPLIIAALYFVVGVHFLAAQMLMALLSSLTACATYLLGRSVFSELVGLVAGMLTAAYPFFVFMAAIPLTENLETLLYVMLALLLITRTNQNAIRNALLTGAVLGLAILNRPQAIGFLPFLALFVCMRHPRNLAKDTRWLLSAVGMCALVVAPWLVRNRVVLGAWTPVSLQGGVALYMGNNPYTQTPLDSIWGGRNGWYDDPRLGAQLSAPSSLESDRKAFRLALEYIAQNPKRSMGYALQKTAVFFSPYHHPLAQVSWYLVLALSMIGFISAHDKWRELLPVYLLIIQTVLTAAVFTSMPRFRAPVEPFFILAASYTISRLVPRKTLHPAPPLAHHAMVGGN